MVKRPQQRYDTLFRELRNQVHTSNANANANASANANPGSEADNMKIELKRYLMDLNSSQSAQSTQSAQSAQSLQTRVYPYVRNALHYLRPGTMLFWVPKPTDELKYGHVALVVEANAEHVVVAQQNRSPPIQVHDTRALFGAINSPNSAYLGLKMVL